MAKRWLRIRVDLVEGDGRVLDPSPGRVMVVPPTSTFDQFGVAVDIAFGRWDTTPERVFTAPSFGRHAPHQPDADVPGAAVLADVMRVGGQFTYLFDTTRGWLHRCLVETALDATETSRLSEIPVPLLGWGLVPDQHGRMSVDGLGGVDGLADTSAATSAGMAAVRSAPDLARVRAADRQGDASALLAAITDHDSRPVLQQVGQALMRAYRSAGEETRARLAPPLEAVRAGAVDRNWEGDDLLAGEIEALLAGTERRGRTLVVDFDELTGVMANGGDDPGGYLHLDTGEVMPAHIRHDPGYWDDAGDAAQADQDDDLWIYIDNDGREQWQDMADFAAAAGDRTTILNVAIQGRGAFRRFRQTVDDLDLREQWRSFSDERSWGRARALLNHHGIRAL